MRKRFALWWSWFGIGAFERFGGLEFCRVRLGGGYPYIRLIMLVQGLLRGFYEVYVYRSSIKTVAENYPPGTLPDYGSWLLNQPYTSWQG